MSASTDTSTVSRPTASINVDYDVVVIGSGFAGLRMLHELRRLGMSAVALEAGTDVGGTWYWNRYPGARTDSESWYYCYSFSDELLDEWVWTERFPTQPQVMSYLRFAADRLDLRKNIRFGTEVRGAAYDAARNVWTVETAGGERVTCAYLVTAAGVLSKPYEPPFPGIDCFQGEWYHTGRWPKEPVDLTGRRVAVIGTGASAIQVIPVIALTAQEVVVFQRTANYVVPARNHPLGDVHRKAIRRDYSKIWEQTQNHVFAFGMDPAHRLFADVPRQQRRAILEWGWEVGGFQFAFETFDDILVDEACNEEVSEFIRNKIRAIVRDPETAEKLCPKDHPFGGKRPPLGHSYYEAFNRENVRLVDVRETPIDEIVPQGVKSADGTEYEVDAIIFATGFDAVTGALTHMHVRGRDNQTLKEKWVDGPRTHLGIAADGFPNMFMICGPLSPFANIPVVIDNVVKWIGRALAYMRSEGIARMEATPAAVDEWVRHVNELVSGSVLADGANVRSWFLGANIPGKTTTTLFYFGGANNFFNEIAAAADEDFSGFDKIRGPGPRCERMVHGRDL